MQSPPIPAAHRSTATWTSELLGGATGALVMLAVVVTLGLLAYAPLGLAVAPQGVTAALTTAAVGGLVFALLGRHQMQLSGPSSATTLIFAGLVVQLAADPQWRASPATMLGPLLAATGLAVALSGLLQIGMALLRLGRLAQYVPQPVLAGFMNGVSLLILLAQLPVLTGLGSGSFQPATLALGLATAAGIWALGRRWPRAPAQLICLGLGVGLFALLHSLWPGLVLGPLVGPVSQGLSLPDLPWQLLAPDGAGFLARHAGAVLTTAVVLALIGSLESVLGALALERALGERARPDAVLLGLGVSNLVVGLCGGMPSVLLRARAIATLQAGGRGQRAALAGALTFLAVALFLGPVVARLPLVVLAGIMLTVAVSLSDRWTQQLIGQWRSGERSADLWQSLAIMALVCAITVWQGFTLGVAAGCVVALAVFVRNMTRSLVQARYTAEASPSRRMWPPAQELFLHTARRQIQVLQLEGALFFGSAEGVAQAADPPPPGARWLVLDLRGVGMIDATGAMMLQRLSLALADGGVQLLLAGVTPTNAHGRRLRAVGCFRTHPRDDWFADVDRAVEAAEQRLLAAAGLADADPRLPLAQSLLFQGLTATQAAVLAAHMPQRVLAPGEVLFRQGDAADGLVVLTRGAITVVAGHTPGQDHQRFASLSAGMMLGETAMLDGAGRSGTAIADGVVELHQLSLAALEGLRAEQPVLAAQVHRNIALHLSQRLRRSTQLRARDVAG
ncbi:MAG: SulP family inorganic anion transporter [Aquabacterium sp.]|nr:SulP family inorganic anion transporter [Aquabacterium sp.]